MSRRVVPEPDPVWRALADPTRRAILDALRDGPRTTGALAAGFPTTRFAVMKHLGVLTEAGLVTVERRGRERLNHLNPVPVQQVYERWVRPFAAPAAAATLSLARAAEATAERTAMTGPTGSPLGLDVRTQHAVGADVEHTWSTLLDPARWWPPCWADHLRLHFEPSLGGRLGTVPSGAVGFADAAEGRLFGVVTELVPGRELVLDGGMDLPGPVTGQVRVRLEPAGRGGTTVVLTHQVVGPVADEVGATYRSGWDDVLSALAETAAADTG